MDFPAPDPQPRSRNARFAAFVVARPGRVLLGALLAVVALAAGAPGLSFSADYRDWFSETTPELAAFEAMQAVYTKDDNVFLMVEPVGGDVFTPSALQALGELTEQAWQVPYATRVESLTNYQHVSATGDDLTVADLVPNPSDVTPDQAARARAVALSEPGLVHRLVSPRGHVAGLDITVALSGKDVSEIPAIVTHVRQLVTETTSRHKGIKVYTTGMVMMNHAGPEASQADMGTLVLLMYGVIILLTWLVSRSVAGTFATVMVILGSILGALGVGGYMQVGLTPVSAVSPTVIMTLAVADCIHLLATYRDERLAGLSKHAALRRSVTTNVVPVLITSVTTAVGFVSLNFSEAPPFRDYGNMSAVGVLLACLLSLTLFPGLLALLPARAPRARPASTSLMASFAPFVVKHRTAAMLATIALTVGLGACIPRIVFDDNFVEYFDDSIPFRAETDHIAAELAGFYNLSFSLETDATGGIANPDYLAKVEEFTTWLRAQAGVQHVATLTDVIKRLNRSMHGDDPAAYRLPTEPGLAAQYLLLYEMSLPYGLDLGSVINLDKTASKLTVTVYNTPTSEIRALEAASNAWLVEHGGGLVRGIASSPSVMFAHVAERNVDSMMSGIALAIGFITAVLILAFRSISMGLLSLLPNVVPIVMGFGLWALVVGQIGVAVAAIASLTMGIVVDDTVHFLSKYLRARRELDLLPAQAVAHAYAHVGRALWGTSLILVAGFSVLTLSAFRMNWTMGLLSAITIAIALLIDLLVLPGLLITFEGRRHQAAADPDKPIIRGGRHMTPMPAPDASH